MRLPNKILAGLYSPKVFKDSWKKVHLNVTVRPIKLLKVASWEARRSMKMFKGRYGTIRWL